MNVSMIRKILSGLILLTVMGVASRLQASTAMLLYLQGRHLPSDVAPMVVSEVLLIPIRALVENAGGSVSWDDRSATVRANHGNSELVISINNPVASLNGVEIRLTSPPQLHLGRTMVPSDLIEQFMSVRVVRNDQRVEVQSIDDSGLTLHVADESGAMVTVRIIPSARELPEKCSGHAVAQTVLSLLAAFNSGDEDGVAIYFSPEFRWFSVSEVGSDGRQNITLTSRAELKSYVRSRYQAREHLRLLTMEVSRGWHGDADITFQARRDASDRYDSQRVVVGKAVLLCGSGQFFVWSMGDL